MKFKNVTLFFILLVLTVNQLQAQEYDSYVKNKKSELKFNNNGNSKNKKNTDSFSVLRSPKYFGMKFKKVESTKRFELQNQTHNNIDIYSATIKINFDDNGTPILYSDNTINYTTVDKSEFPEIKLIESYSNIKLSDTLKSEKIYFPISESEIIPAIKIIYKKDNRSYLSIFNSDYEVVYNQSLSFEKDLPTFPANASVFNPDPITSAHTVYNKNTEFSHNHGATNTSLENEQIDVEIECYKENSTYYLKNNYCEIVDNDEPRWAPVTSDNGNFNFNRSQIGFQQVNAFYHISEMKKYLNSIGFEDAVDYSIKVDADGEDGIDNSHFNSDGNRGNTTFGAYIPQKYLPEDEKPNEHVPDAEDAEVIIHEYTHAISNSYNDFPISNERFTIEEAMADYIAVSYATNIDDHNWEKIFKWDAHNEFWDGRIAISTKCYSDILYFPSNNYYQHSDIWTAPLMDMYFELGKETTDKLVLHTITALDVNTTMEQAALIMMAMDTLNNDHENSMAILNTFKKYCILNDGHLSNYSYSMSRFKIINSKGFAQGGEMKIDFGYLLSGEIKICDINGLNIFNKKINLKKNFNFSSEDLNSGIYLINVITNYGSRTIKVCKY